VIGISRGIGLGLGVARAGGAAGNGLLNNLVAYWPLNEAAGANNALDLHSNGLTLTQVASPGSAAGVVYAGARTFNGSSQYFSRASEALLQTGDVDFTIAAWVYRSVSGTSDPMIISKWGANFEFILWYVAGSILRYRFFVRKADNSGGVVVSANTYGAPELNAWHMIIAHHDAINDTIGIQVQNSAIDTAAITGGVLVRTSDLQVGARQSDGLLWSGRIGPVAMWKSAAGGGGVLTAMQRTALWAGGAGLAYANFTT